MRRPWKRRGEHSDIERRLREERPNPSEDLVDQLAVHAGERRHGATRRVSFGLAYALTGLFVAAAIGLGGLGSPVGTAERILSFDNAHEKNPDKGRPAKDQYDEKVTICHRPPGNPTNGQTLTLPRSAAEAHLRNHPLDSRGPCPPTPKHVTICHRSGKSSPGQTLRVPVAEVVRHLPVHRYDELSACGPGKR